MTAERLDLGDGHTLRFTTWRPDHTIEANAVRYANQPDIERVGAIETHLTPTGEVCEGAIMFDLPGVRDLFPERPLWTVESWDPLTLSPSLQCGARPDHGHVRDGRWVRA